MTRRIRESASNAVTFLVGILFLVLPTAARADVVVDWTVIGGNAAGGVNGGARNMAIVSLAMFEAVNAITGDYEPYLGTVSAPEGASPEAAAVAAAYRVLRTYGDRAGHRRGSGRRAVRLAGGHPRWAGQRRRHPGRRRRGGGAVDPGGQRWIVAGDLLRAGVRGHRRVAGRRRAARSIPATGLRAGISYQVAHMTPLAIPSPSAFRPEPPPAMDSYRYYMAQREVLAVGDLTSTERPADLADVARVYNGIGNTYGVRLIAPQLSRARGDSLSENARNFALIAMAVNDAFIASFEAKYHYRLWRPETAIRAGADDGNQWTAGDTSFIPFITTPCFPSYPSNHASGSSAGLEMMRRLYGAAGHDLTLENPALPGVALHYTALHQVLADVSDARVYGGIHFRFDQEAGDRLGREVAKFVEKEFLRPRRP